MRTLREIYSHYRRVNLGIKPRTLLEMETAVATAHKIACGFSAAQCQRDDEETMAEGRLGELKVELKPQGTMQDWLVGVIATATVRIERCQLDEEAAKYQKAERAGFAWAIDRQVEVLQLIERLAAKPALVASKLRQTLQGCELLLERFGILAARVAGAANDGQPTPLDPPGRSMACDLLGLTVEERLVRTPLDPPAASDADVAAHQAAFLADQIAALERLRTGELIALDAVDRAAAMAGTGPAINAEIRQIRRDEAAAHRRRDNALEELRLLQEVVRIREQKEARRRMEESLCGALIENTPEQAMAPAAPDTPNVERQPEPSAVTAEPEAQATLVGSFDGDDTTVVRSPRLQLPAVDMLRPTPHPHLSRHARKGLAAKAAHRGHG